MRGLTRENWLLRKAVPAEPVRALRSLPRRGERSWGGDKTHSVVWLAHNTSFVSLLRSPSTTWAVSCSQCEHWVQLHDNLCYVSTHYLIRQRRTEPCEACFLPSVATRQGSGERCSERPPEVSCPSSVRIPGSGATAQGSGATTPGSGSDHTRERSDHTRERKRPPRGAEATTPGSGSDRLRNALDKNSQICYNLFIVIKGE